MKKTNWYLIVGCLVTAIALILKHVLPGLHDSVYGLCLGVGIGLELIGLHSVNHDLSSIKKYKMNLLRKIFHKPVM